LGSIANGSAYEGLVLGIWALITAKTESMEGLHLMGMLEVEEH